MHTMPDRGGIIPPARRGGSLRQQSQHPSILAVTVGIYELAMGCLMLALPQAFEVRLYPQVLHRLSEAGPLFVTGGIFALLSHATAARRGGLLPVALALIGSFPLAVSAVFSARAGVWTGTVVTGLLACGMLADAVRPPADGPERRMTTLSIVGAVAAALIGVLALAAPDRLHATIVRAVDGRTALLGAGMLISFGMLLCGALVPRLRAAARIVAALPFWILSMAFVGVQGWAGVLIYGVLGSAVAAEPGLQRALRRRAAERAEQSGWSAAFEFATEAVAWGFALLVVLVASMDAQPDRRLGQVILALCLSIFTLIWYHLVSVGTTGLRNTVIATAVYAFLGVALVQLTDGARSPYLYAYLFPIIALAWTQTPQTIVLPLSIPAGALLIESVLAMRAGSSGADVLFVALPRLAGLLLIAGFTYLLARRNLQNSQRIRDARRQFEAVLTHMGEGLIATNHEGRITLCNPAALELIGAPEQPLPGRLLPEVLPMRRTDGETLRPEAHPVRRALEGHRVPWERLMLERPDGGKPLAVSATPLASVNGSRGAIIMLRDIRAEVEMERMRDDFFFIASHELRTPLTVMKGNLEMAVEASSDPTLRRSLEEALHSTARLIRMVNDFLDAARLEHGAVSLRLENETLPTLVQQAVETLRPDAQRKGLTITYRAPNGLPPVRIDVERTLQIFLNVIGNAIRYTQQGGIEITHAGDGQVVETIIKDTGIGIAQEHHDRLFARFGQVGRGLTRAAGGSGLGLYISRRLAEQMGGTVILKASAPGEGSAFAVRLPVARVTAAVR